MSVSPESIHRLFNPRSIALVGATDKSTWSLSTFRNLNLHAFPGGIHLVNPRGGTVHDRPAYARIADLPPGVDLAYVMVPTDAVPDVLEQAADHGIRSAVVLTSGFAETGEDGVRREREVVELAQRRGLAILGPNGNGFINAAAGITPYGLPIPQPLLRGPIGVVLQSGALASAVLGFARSRNLGVSLLVSMGNEAMLSLTDVVRHLVHDENTRVITLFVESIRQPAEFLAVADEALAAGKPIVALKVGRSQAGARVARAHTGSLVGDDAVIDAVFRQHGVVRVDSIEDLIITAGLLADAAPLPGHRFGVVTASGGACEIIADDAEREGLELPAFAPETVRRLRAVVPPFAAVQNPVDVTGYVLVDRHLLVNALGVVRADPGVDAVVVVTELPRDEPPDPALDLERCGRAADALRAPGKPVIALGNALTDITPYGRSVAEKTDFPSVVGGIHHGIAALGHAVRWSRRHRERQQAAAVPHVEPLAPPPAASGTWSEHRAGAFLAEHGIPVVPSALVRDPDDAVEVAERVGYPVAVKLAADGVAHKSDIGGVRLGLTNAADVRRAYADVVDAGWDAGETVLGALVQPERHGGAELLVGVVTDPAWGHVLAVGLGGVWVEVLGDTALRVLPVGRDEIRRALGELRGFRLLQGARGVEAADLDAVVEVVAGVAELAGRLGERLESVEINPLLVRGSRVEALDALITWTDQPLDNGGSRRAR